ncbi:hypothetical protein ABT187_49370, partial [Streptomyces sp. NPDC001817]|uniref:hypothetical protein n=1 Tax=Streptomyces sp. NPDC001817 TaxID=3154398 RepID=UPI0033315952
YGGEYTNNWDHTQYTPARTYTPDGYFTTRDTHPTPFNKYQAFATNPAEHTDPSGNLTLRTLKRMFSRREEMAGTTGGATTAPPPPTWKAAPIAGKSNAAHEKWRRDKEDDVKRIAARDAARNKQKIEQEIEEDRRAEGALRIKIKLGVEHVPEGEVGWLRTFTELLQEDLQGDLADAVRFSFTRGLPDQAARKLFDDVDDWLKRTPNVMVEEFHWRKHRRIVLADYLIHVVQAAVMNAEAGGFSAPLKVLEKELRTVRKREFNIHKKRGTPFVFSQNGIPIWGHAWNMPK